MVCATNGVTSPALRCVNAAAPLKLAAPGASEQRVIYSPLRECSGPIEAWAFLFRTFLPASSPLRECSGPIEAAPMHSRRTSRRALRCVNAAAPLKPRAEEPDRDPVALVSPLRECSGPIEAKVLSSLRH